ncbi:MAG TPA: hypothetical protein VHB47_02270 [Thermoanaerobaculia bacterium]|jgi:hypothetical protein|nr:hypothetical protein [Thermoanaerobaculia bacterium]
MRATAPPVPPYILISKRFKAYDKTIRDIWEVYQFHHFYLPRIHELIKKKDMPALSIVSLGALSPKEQKPRDTLGAISHIMSQVTTQRSLIAAVAQSEAFLQYLVTRVLRDYPQRLLAGIQSEQGAREGKLLEIIVNSADKWEMLEKLIEERVRGLFYGAPGDFFMKDKARLGFGDHFLKHYRTAVERYVEISARRNLLIHNDGRVDRKYLREVPGSTLALKQRVPIDEVYLRDALLTLRGLSATAGILVCERVYSSPVPSGKMLARSRSFGP